MHHVKDAGDPFQIARPVARIDSERHARIRVTKELCGGRVLYLVPSLALMSQTVRKWSIDASELPFVLMSKWACGACQPVLAARGRWRKEFDNTLGFEDLSCARERGEGSGPYQLRSTEGARRDGHK